MALVNYEDANKYFEAVAQAADKTWLNREWCGDVENCDVCRRPFGDETYMIDGPAMLIPSAPWGNLCVVCAYKTARQIGWGKGQLYKYDGRCWQLVAGGPPPYSDDEASTF